MRNGWRSRSNLGADHVVDVEQEDTLARVMEITAGKGVDVVLDCTAGAGTSRCCSASTRSSAKAGRWWCRAYIHAFPDFPMSKVTTKAITLKSARGHSYKACELALQQLASNRFPLELVTTHTFGLKDTAYAIKSVGGEGAKDVIHVSLMPWN